MVQLSQGILQIMSNSRSTGQSSHTLCDEEMICQWNPQTCQACYELNFSYNIICWKCPQLSVGCTCLPPISPILRGREKSKHQVIACKKLVLSLNILLRNPSCTLQAISEQGFEHMRSQEHMLGNRGDLYISSCCSLAEL